MATDKTGTVVARHDYLPFGAELPAGYAGRTSPWGTNDSVSQKFTEPHDLQTFIAHALNAFGPKRCMFGSDWPVCRLAAGWKQVLAAFTQACGPLPQGVRDQLLGETAIRFYGL